MGSRLPEVGLLFVVVVWASTFVLTKQAFDEISPLAFAFVRFIGITLLALLVLAVSVSGGKAQWQIRRTDVPRFALVGVCGYTLYQLGFVLGLERTSPFSSALLIGTVPLFTIVVLTLAGERQPLQAWLGLGVAFVGTAVFLLDKLAAPGSLVGDVLSLGSAISFALYGVFNRPLVKRYPTATYTAYTIIAGAIPLVAVSLPAAAAQNWAAVSLGGWIVVAYMIVLPVYVAYMVWNWGIARRGAAAASSFTLLVPLVSGVLSVMMFGEAFDVAKLVGAGLVLLGLVALQRRTAQGLQEAPTMEPESL
ncbi:MAG TPA: DMT family transporter [Chloroflexota bacterium]|jgi:drug/metabolite transporter (DMT)-like permease|nr:DMT family transporter [Chloroflexota bacterium]